MLQYVPISIQNTLTQTRKKSWNHFRKLILSCRNEMVLYVLYIKYCVNHLEVLFKAQTMNFSYEGQITPNQILVDIFR